LAVTAAVVTSGALALAALILAAPGAVLGGLCILVICCRRPRWVFFGDERRSEPVMDVLRRQKFALFGARFAVRSAAGEPLASLRKHYTWRTRWSCSRPDGSLWFVIHRGSSRPRLMRRFDTAGAGTTPDLVFADAGSDQVLGGLAFVGPGSGRCVLDMRADPDRSIDRRVAIAATVMLSIAGR
jgi:hypothetical protein